MKLFVHIVAAMQRRQKIILQTTSVFLYKKLQYKIFTPQIAKEKE